MQLWPWAGAPGFPVATQEPSESYFLPWRGGHAIGAQKKGQELKEQLVCSIDFLPSVLCTPWWLGVGGRSGLLECKLSLVLMGLTVAHLVQFLSFINILQEVC